MNFILNTDSYKFSHFKFYPPGTEEVYSYLESRGGAYSEIVVLGLERFCEELFNTQITKSMVLQAADFAKKHGVPFNFEGWMTIVNEFNGFLPVEIQGVPEGTVIPTHNVIATVRNTDPRFAWLTSYVETAMLRAVWYPSTVASRIRAMKIRIQRTFIDASDIDVTPFSLLDFSSRGAASTESSILGGMAYLLFFAGSDNVVAVDYVNKFYNEDMSGFSLPATEHSIMTAWGLENERDSLNHILNETPEGSTVSIVVDSWDTLEAAKLICSLARVIVSKNITVVVRPDSGDMYHIVSELLGIFEPVFGTTENGRGYKILNNIRILWGDGITEHTVEQPFLAAIDNYFAPENILTGSGGGLIQASIDRDTCKFAFKASNVVINGVSKGIRKDPITDPGKRSKRGYLELRKDDAGFYTVSELSEQPFRVINKYWKTYYCYEPGDEEPFASEVDAWEDIKERANESILPR